MIILQTLPDDCAETSVAMIVNHTEQDVVNTALHLNIYHPGIGTWFTDLPRLLGAYNTPASRLDASYSHLRHTVAVHHWAIAGVSAEALEGLPLPAILSEDHAVVVVKVTATHVTVNDPLRGQYTVTKARFLAAWGPGGHDTVI